MTTASLSNTPAATPAAASTASSRSRPVRVRLATTADIPALADIHSAGMPDDFMVRLGRAFQTRVLFPTMIEALGSCIYVADDEDRVLGFLVARRGFGRLVSELLAHHPLWFLLSCTATVVRHPGVLRVLPPIADQLRARGRETDTRGSAELFLTAVAESARGRGVGRALVEHSIAELRKAGVTAYRVLMHAENTGAERLYERIGFGELRAYSFAGQAWHERTLRLTPTDNPTAGNSDQAG